MYLQTVEYTPCTGQCVTAINRKSMYNSWWTLILKLRSKKSIHETKFVLGYRKYDSCGFYN